MSVIGNEDWMTASEVCLRLDISKQTLYRWYAWWDNKDIEKPDDLFLPKKYYKDRRKKLMFRRSDLKYFSDFQDKINTTHKGVMAKFNAYYQWGKRGEKYAKSNGINLADYLTGGNNEQTKTNG